jgi:hypothetical protein
MAYMKDSTGRRLDSFEVAGTEDVSGIASNAASVVIDQRSVKKAIGLADNIGAPRFTRLNNGQPILTLEAQNPAPGAASPAATTNTIYWPWIVYVRDALGEAALDDYYMFYSTDHETTHALSGIWLATAPTPEGPWTGRGRTYIDNVTGNQTETPTVIWNEQENLFFMYYQQSNVSGSVGSQVTLLATSPTALPGSWTRVGVVIDVVAGTTPGDGHVGYARVFRIGRTWYAWHLLGGAGRASGISRSSNGRVWITETRPLSAEADKVGRGYRVQWNASMPIAWRGATWVVGMYGDYAANAEVKYTILFAAPLAADYRKLLSKPMPQLEPPLTANGESTDHKCNQAFVGRDDQLYLVYQCGEKFFIGKAE